MKPLLLVLALSSATAAYALGTGDTARFSSENALATSPLPQEVVAASATKVAGGTVSGSIMFKGERPEPKEPFKIGKEESEGCGDSVDPENKSLLIAEKGGIANVVVSLKAKDFEVKLPEKPIVIDQIGCRFEPHVQIVPAGAVLQFKNSDGTNHNIHTYAKKNQNKNNNVSGGQTLDVTLEHAEVFETKCDIHPWMSAYVFVCDDTHWAVTDAEGNFSLAGVPAGTYKLELWHETLGKGKTAEVEVKDGAVASITHEWSEKKDGGSKGRGRGRR